MTQISKHIPIIGHGNTPLVLLIQEYATLEGNAYLAINAEEVAADATTRYFWRTTGNDAYAFRLDIALSANVATFDPPIITLREMTAALTPDVWDDYPINLHRLYSDVGVFQVGTHATANTPFNMWYVVPGDKWKSAGEWFIADPNKTYGIKFINNDSSNAIYLNYWIYFITGLK